MRSARLTEVYPGAVGGLLVPPASQPCLQLCPEVFAASSRAGLGCHPGSLPPCKVSTICLQCVIMLQQEYSNALSSPAWWTTLALPTQSRSSARRAVPRPDWRLERSSWSWLSVCLEIKSWSSGPCNCSNKSRVATPHQPRRSTTWHAHQVGRVRLPYEHMASDITCIHIILAFRSKPFLRQISLQANQSSYFDHHNHYCQLLHNFFSRRATSYFDHHYFQLSHKSSFTYFL